MVSHLPILQRSLKLAVVCLCAIFAAAIFWGPETVTGAQDKRVASIKATPTPIARTRSARSKPKYSEFKHDVKAHKLECSSCHKFPSENWKSVRPAETAFPDITDYPKHASCVNCHKQQFFRGSTPVICSICHTNPGPRNSSRHPFPNPRERFDESPKGKTADSDFVVAFPHEIHVDIVSRVDRGNARFVNVGWLRTRRAEESCKVCHQTMLPQGDSDEEYLVKPPADLGDGFWLKKGTFKSAPTGHTTCFTCHNADSGMNPQPADCAKCHTLRSPFGPPDVDPAMLVKMGATTRLLRDAWLSRTSSGTFRHEFFGHTDLECATCHNVSKIGATQASRKVPVTSCNMCHITATTEDGGILNFEVEQRKKDTGFRCVKCHLSYGAQPIPVSHTEAITEAGK